MINAENRVGDLFELTFQKAAASSHWLELAVSWTYWMSEFTVLGFALLWVYLRRNEHFRNFRNWVLLAGVIGLVGYVVYPTAPPRMFTTDGFVDTLSKFASLNHGSGVIEHLHAGNQQYLVGEFFGAWRAWDGILALDYLLTRKEVDPQHVVITGNSGGGTHTCVPIRGRER